MRFIIVSLCYILSLQFSLNVFATDQITGAWEGQMLNPRRPMVLYVNFNDNIARIDAVGSQTLPVQNLKIEGTGLYFTLQVDQKLEFSGTMIGGQISGTFGTEKKTPFALNRLPLYPTPRNRVEAWNQDLDAVLNRFLKYDRSFSPRNLEAAVAFLNDLQLTAANKTDEEMIVGLSRAIALSENAHTRLYLLRNRTELRRYPIRVWWFNDGLYVVKATTGHQALLGCRVESIAGEDPVKIREKVGALFAGNESWRNYKSVYYMTSPEILSGLGILKDMEQTPFSFRCGERSQTKTITPMPLVRSDKPTEAWWDLTPFRKDHDGNWRHALDPAKITIPLYLKSPDQHYWYEYLSNEQALYFQYNRSQNMQSGETLAQFGERLLAELQNRPVQKLIVDLRFNTGGNLGIARDLMEKLKAAAKVKSVSVYVLIGRATFSAGISHAVQWKESGNALFIGEPLGDGLDTFSEGGNLILPNSKLTVHYANGFHNYSTREYPQFQPYFLDMNVQDLKPDRPVAVASKDYFSGRDPVLESVLDEPQRTSAAFRRNQL